MYVQIQRNECILCAIEKSMNVSFFFDVFSFLFYAPVRYFLFAIQWIWLKPMQTKIEKRVTIAIERDRDAVIEWMKTESKCKSKYVIIVFRTHLYVESSTIV